MACPGATASGAGGGTEDHGPDTVLAFPGQGGDWRDGPAVLDAQRRHPLVAALAGALGTDRWSGLDPLDTRNTQPVTYVAGLVGPVASVDQGEVASVLGHSLGEITAAAWAGAVDLEEGLHLVVERAALGNRSQAARPGAMAAFMRADAEALEDLRLGVLADSGGDDSVLVVAVTNSPTQHVLSGDEDLVFAAVERCNARGGVARRLAIGGAYHSPLMAPAVEGFRARTRAAVRRAPSVPVMASTTSSALTKAAPLADALADALVRPVDWPTTVSAAGGLGAHHAVDAGPGSTLARLARFLESDLTWC